MLFPGRICYREYMKWLYGLLCALGVLFIASCVLWFALFVTARVVEAPTNASRTANENTNTTTNTSSVTSGNADAHSCNQDAVTFCKDTPAGKLNLVHCLLDEHGDEISDACRQSLERREILNQELVAACEQDRGTYCRGVKPEPGSEPMVDCLEEHYTQLSAECAAAFDAHAEAKPTD